MRRWKVTDVDTDGVATLEMTIASMRWEQKASGGEAEVFDSTKPDDLKTQPTGDSGARIACGVIGWAKTQ